MRAVETEPDLVIKSERVGLGPLRRDLADSYARWMNSEAVRFGLENLSLATTQSQESWVDDEAKAGAEEEPRSVSFTIYDLADGTPVGTAILFSISYRRGGASFGVALGERRGQGLGSEATRLTLDWGFHVLGLRNVMLEVMAWNEAAISAYEKVGFRRIGVRRKAVISRGERVDIVLMDAIAEDFRDSVLSR